MGRNHIAAAFTGQIATLDQLTALVALMTRAELLARIERINVSRRDDHSALYKPLLLLLLLGRARAHGPRRVAFLQIESTLKELVDRYSPRDSTGSVGQPWWHLPTDRLWRVVDSEGNVIRESGTSRGNLHVPSLEALRQQYGEFPVEVEELLSRDPEASTQVAGRLVDRYFRDRHEDERMALLSDLNLAAGPTSNVPWSAPRRRRAYVAPERQPIARRDPFEVDPDAVDRGNSAHAATLDALASFLKSRHIEPLCSDPDEPAFDLAWEQDGMLFVAEVKSVTAANEEKQLRLGLGQILRYRQTIQGADGRVVAAVLVPETQPSAEGWRELCEALNVKLIWPPQFDGL